MKNIKDTTGKRILVSDLKREKTAVRKKAEAAIGSVLKKGWYVLGKELEAFEREFADYAGAAHAVGMASGTDALQLALRSLQIPEGSEVITAVNTAIPTAMAIIAAGGVPRFVDVKEDSFNIDKGRLESSITKKTAAIMPVHLYGNPCEMDDIMCIAKANNIYVVEDACQAHGASYNGKNVGTFGEASAFSFYPTKNLGCYGDGGILVTDDKKICERASLLRNYGQRTRYSCDIEGVNSRLDEIQAAVLRVKLKYLDKFNKRRQYIAAQYDRYLNDIDEVVTPARQAKAKHVYHLYVIRCKGRDGLKEYLDLKGVETQVHYPVPLHLQKAFSPLGYMRGDFPVAEKLAHEILSLPIFPELKDRELKRVCALIKDYYRRPRR